MPLSYYLFNYRMFFLRNIHILMNAPQSTTPQQYCVKQVVTDGSKCGFKLYCTPQNIAMINVNAAIPIIVHFLFLIKIANKLSEFRNYL